MTVGICGLGLIGGSMAKCYKLAGHTVLAFDTNTATLGFAEISGMALYGNTQVYKKGK